MELAVNQHLGMNLILHASGDNNRTTILYKHANGRTHERFYVHNTHTYFAYVHIHVWCVCV